MTEKEQRILHTALELFADQGFHETSTSEIAERADVSEGLIYKHFGNKRNLLNTISENAGDEIEKLFGPAIFEEEPEEAIRKVIELPFDVEKKDYDFWRLQFMLKWDKEYEAADKMEPLVEKLTEVFRELDYEKPEMEAKLLTGIIDIIAIWLLRDELDKAEKFKEFVLTKYKV